MKLQAKLATPAVSASKVHLLGEALNGEIAADMLPFASKGPLSFPGCKGAAGLETRVAELEHVMRCRLQPPSPP